MGLLPNPVASLPPELKITLPPDSQGFWLREQFERGALRDPELIQGLLVQARHTSLRALCVGSCGVLPVSLCSLRVPCALCHYAHCADHTPAR